MVDSMFVTLIAVGAVVLAALIALGVWRQVRLAQADSAFKRALIERGFSAEELERLFRAHASGAAEETPPGEEDALREVAEHLSAAGATGEEMEQVMILVRAADAATRQAIAQAVGAVADTTADKDQMLGVIRGLCQTSRPGKPTPASSPSEHIVARP
ncbi:MAG: hypothetical protein L0Z62_06395 [Gemmataceae bacterium]|nr:hypothetical protein [Gemmataceae bacterium]